MELQLLRNATLRLKYAGLNILVDPCLGAKGSSPSIAGVAPNPIVELPISVEAALDGIDLVVISHLHRDHFDPAAAAALPKSIPVLCQSSDVEALVKQGFTHVRALTEREGIQRMTIAPTPGQHGTGEILAKMGQVIGFTLEAAGEPTLYWAGDTVLTEGVLHIIDTVKPDVIITHSGGATLSDTLLIMDDAQTLQMCEHAGDARVIAVHLEALDHCTVSRHNLRAAAELKGISAERLLIPADGELLTLSVPHSEGHSE
ncbi:MBL fold metallo-hydrolase [Silvibacterium sp.]|uniref:MBL fold metallo-hydrolase n=1 Tax=Silvibacterium sp. TaxID=1964179 RepID=UPI0039E69D32